MHGGNETMKPPTEHEDTDLGDDYPPISDWHERQMERADRARAERKDREWERSVSGVDETLAER